MPEFPLQSGPQGSIVEWGETDSSLQRLYSGECSDATEEDKVLVIRHGKRFCKTGKFPSNKEKFNFLESGIYEIKGDSLRLVGFFDNSKFVIILCRIKKRRRIPYKDLVKRAKKLRTSYYEAQGQ